MGISTVQIYWLSLVWQLLCLSQNACVFPLHCFIDMTFLQKKYCSHTTHLNDFESKCTQLIVCYSDPYVKVSLMCEGRRLKKRKTTTKKNTLNPVYNEAIIFDIPPENVDQVSLSIAVMDYDR